LTVPGHVVAGLVLGLVCFLVTILGRGADASIVSVLVVNALVGRIDRFTRVRRTRLRR
jgi:Na+-translocating ferredoxin:NAD+ oxidoreductase RnfD subunit